MKKLTYLKKGNILMQCDFIARTSSDEDFIRHDKFDIINGDDTPITLKTHYQPSG